MESEEFMNSIDLCVCVLRNMRGMLESPPDLNEAVSHVILDIQSHVVTMCRC